MRQQAFQLGAKFGCTAEDTTGLVDCLRDQDPTALFTTSEEVIPLASLDVPHFKKEEEIVASKLSIYECFCTRKCDAHP